MANKELLTKVQRMVPPMLEKFHKGTIILCYASPDQSCHMLTSGQVSLVAWPS